MSRVTCPGVAPRDLGRRLATGIMMCRALDSGRMAGLASPEYSALRLWARSQERERGTHSPAQISQTSDEDQGLRVTCHKDVFVSNE